MINKLWAGFGSLNKLGDKYKALEFWYISSATVFMYLVCIYSLTENSYNLYQS